MTATPPEVRAARSYLRSTLQAGSQDISPRKFANAAKELDVSFDQLADLLARLYAGGQGEYFDREQALEQGLANGASPEPGAIE